MQRRRVLAHAAIAVIGAAALPAARASVQPPAEVLGELPAPPRLQGQGRLRFLGLHVYDIRLWTPGPVGPDDWVERPLALEIAYGRNLVGRLIAERSLEEMQRAGPLAPDQRQRWLAAMTELFPDVKNGDRITGVHRPGGGARFFVNGSFRGEVRDAEFSRRFFGIWLGPATSEPALRQSLLALR